MDGEVYQLVDSVTRTVFVPHDVVRLYVSVDDTLGMHESQASEDVLTHLAHLQFTHACRRLLFKPFLQCAPRQALHDHADQAFCKDLVLMQPHDIFMGDPLE